MIELFVIFGIGLVVAGWWMVRRGHRSTDSGLDPVYTPYTDSGPLGCRDAGDRDGAADARADDLCSDGDGGDGDCGVGGDSGDSGGGDGGD